MHAKFAKKNYQRKILWTYNMLYYNILGLKSILSCSMHGAAIIVEYYEHIICYIITYWAWRAHYHAVLCCHKSSWQLTVSVRMCMLAYARVSDKAPAHGAAAPLPLRPLQQSKHVRYCTLSLNFFCLKAMHWGLKYLTWCFTNKGARQCCRSYWFRKQHALLHVSFEQLRYYNLLFGSVQDSCGCSA